MPGSSQETEVTGGKSSRYRFTADRDGEPSGHDMVVLALCGMCREMIIRSTHFYKHVNLEKVTTHLSLEPPAHLDPHAYERRAKYVMNTLRACAARDDPTTCKISAATSRAHESTGTVSACFSKDPQHEAAIIYLHDAHGRDAGAFLSRQ